LTPCSVVHRSPAKILCAVWRGNWTRQPVFAALARATISAIGSPRTRGTLLRQSARIVRERPVKARSSSCDVHPNLGGTMCTPMAANKSKYRPTGAAKSPEQYRRLADQCRETARTASARNERADLLAKARLWDLLADRVGRPLDQQIGSRQCRT